MLLFLIILVLIIVILAVIFAIQNVNVILVSFLMWKLEGSLALILLFTFVLGFVAGLLILLPKLLKRSFAMSGQKKKLEELQKKPEEKDEPKNITEQQSSDKNDRY